MDVKLLSKTYQEEYDLEQAPSALETMRIWSIKQERKYCEEQCTGLNECQFAGADQGFKPEIIADNLNHFAKNHLYFGVSKCGKQLKSEQGAKRRQLLKKSNLPSPQPLRENHKRILERMTRRSYYIIGAHGSGKTNFLSHIGQKYLQEDAKVKYVSQPELLTELRVGSETYHAQLQECKEADVLLIDDWRGRESRYNEEQLWVILNHRELRQRITIIASREDLTAQSTRLREKLERYTVIR